MSTQLTATSNIHWLRVVGKCGIENVDDIAQVRDQFFLVNFFIHGFTQQEFQPKEQNTHAIRHKRKRREQSFYFAEITCKTCIVKEHSTS